MKLLFIALIASTLIACSNSKDKAKPQATTVGALALKMIEKQTTDDGAPLDINSIKFKADVANPEYIDLGS